MTKPKAKQNQPVDVPSLAVRLCGQVRAFVARRPAWTTAICSFLYLLIFQNSFLFSGDTWAEAFVEHLQDALNHRWIHVVTPSWIGYIFFIPSFLAKLYVSLHWPLGYIDIFYRVTVLVFTVTSVALVAHPIHRSVIRNDYFRIAFALACLLLLHDVSSFSFINVWYIGFVPLIFYGLSNTKTTIRQQVFYTIAGSLVALTKPSPAVAPFILYRMIRTKEYVSNGIVLAATLLQTWLLLRADAQGSVQAATEAKRLALIAGVELFKLFHLPVPSLALAGIADLLLVAMIYIIWRRYNIVVAAMMIFGSLLSLHAYYIAAGTSMFTGGPDKTALIYDCNVKEQQEVMINIFYLLIGALALMAGYRQLLSWRRLMHIVHLRTYALAGASVLTLVALGAIYQPIDRGKSIDIAPFRYSLTVGQPTCIPMPTLVQGVPDVNWYFSYKTSCGVANAFSIPNTSSFNQGLSGSGQSLTLLGWPNQHLSSILLLVKTPQQKNAYVVLTDTQTGTPYYAPTHRMDNGLSYAAFNVNGIAEAPEYTFQITSNSPDATIGYFSDLPGSFTYYPYFMQD